MKCEYTPCTVEFEPKGTKRFCCDKHRSLAYMAAHYQKRKHPKRVRDRKRERLMRELCKGWTLGDLEGLLATGGLMGERAQ